MTALLSAPHPAEPQPIPMGQRVGKYEMRVATRPHTPESQARWDRRVETLTAWLLSQWQAAGRATEHVDATVNN